MTAQSHPDPLSGNYGFSRPTPITRLVISCVLVLHFGAVITAIFGIRNSGPTPRFIERLYPWASPYLEALNFDTNYQFYAPDVGAESRLWACLIDQHGQQRWQEWPRDGTGAVLEQHLRDTIAPNTVSHAVRNPSLEEGYELSQISEKLLPAFVRKFVRRENDRSPVNPPVAAVLYRITNRMMSTEEARLGFAPDDLRMQVAVSLGSFDASGRRIGDSRLRVAPLDLLANEIIESLRRDNPDQAQFAIRLRDEAPESVRRLIEQAPELASMPTAERRGEIQRRLAPPEGN